MIFEIGGWTASVTSNKFSTRIVFLDNSIIFSLLKLVSQKWNRLLEQSQSYKVTKGSKIFNPVKNINSTPGPGPDINSARKLDRVQNSDSGSFFSHFYLNLWFHLLNPEIGSLPSPDATIYFMFISYFYHLSNLFGIFFFVRNFDSIRIFRNNNI